MRAARRLRLGAAAVLLAAAPAAAAGDPERPRLVVFVAVDQLLPEYLVRFRELYTGGLRRLTDDGAVFTNARYRHANTETGPGHAVLLSGRHARHTGIVANQWYDALAGGRVNVVDDAASRPLPGPRGRAASPANYLGLTVGDMLKAASPQSRVVGVAGKDRAAVLMAGRRADAAYWFETEARGFGTSTYYMAALPPWLAAWNAARPIDALHGRAWERLLPETAVYERLAGPDDAAGERDVAGRVFPHKIQGTPGQSAFYEDVKRTPFADDITAEVALLALDAHQLGRDEATDLLAVGLSATDSIGHSYGPQSQEVMDQALRLDRLLGRLMAAVEERVGRGRVLFALSADHGAMPLVESLRARGIEARRAAPAVLETAVRAALQARYPGRELIADFDAPDIYLDLEAVRRHGLRRSEVEGVIEQALMGTGLVDRVYTAARLLGDAPAGDPEFDLFRNAFFEPRSPHLMVRLKPYIRLDAQGWGAGHGSVHDYDRHVPLALLGPGIRAGAFAAACGPEDLAPTLSALLGLDYRLETGQRVLAEALSPAAPARGE